MCEAENDAKASEDKVHGVTIQHAGTRHNVMRNITVYLRVHGCSAADCRDELKRWITTQDTSLFGSSPEEIDKDIEELIRWAYSDSFVIRQRSAPNQATVYMCQMEEILKRESRSERRLLFLLSMRGQMLQPRISTKDAAKVTGISQTTVKKMLRRMLDAHVISCTPSMKFCLQDGTFSATSRGYTVALPAGNQDELHLQLTMKE